MASTSGRRVVIPLTNKSGGSVAAGDVVIVDTGNNDAFTTTTSAGFTGGVGIAQETIANNAVGRVLISGYAALVNVSASVTRGHFGATHTVAKQAASSGATRGVGTFCQFLTGGTTPDALMYPVDLLGSSLTNPMSAVGDIIQGTTAGAPARLAAPLAGKVLTGAGVTTPLVYSYPPGYELDYVEFTANVNITGTSSGGANTIVTGNSVAYDGSTVVWVEFFTESADTPAGNNNLTFELWLDGAALLIFAQGLGPDGTNTFRWPVDVKRKQTPSNASHTYAVKAYVNSGTGVVRAGAGTGGTAAPGFIRITKA